MRTPHLRQEDARRAVLSLQKRKAPIYEQAILLFKVIEEELGYGSTRFIFATPEAAEATGLTEKQVKNAKALLVKAGIIVLRERPIAGLRCPVYEVSPDFVEWDGLVAWEDVPKSVKAASLYRHVVATEGLEEWRHLKERVYAQGVERASYARLEAEYKRHCEEVALRLPDPPQE